MQINETISLYLRPSYASDCLSWLGSKTACLKALGRLTDDHSRRVADVHCDSYVSIGFHRRYPLGVVSNATGTASGRGLSRSTRLLDLARHWRGMRTTYQRFALWIIFNFRMWVPGPDAGVLGRSASSSRIFFATRPAFFLLFCRFNLQNSGTFDRLFTWSDVLHWPLQPLNRLSSSLMNCRTYLNPENWPVASIVTAMTVCART